MIEQLIRKERAEIFILHFLQVALFIITKLYLAYLDADLLSFSTVFFLVFIAIFENFHYRAIRDLNYTYWTLTIIKFFWIFYSLVGSGHILNNFTFGIFTFSILLFLSIEVYLMNSPIYFPRVQWWEYDFRYRGDLRIKIAYKGQEFKARLADLRREAGCIISFEPIKLGESLTVKTYYKNEDISFDVRIVSMRENIPGRGYRYGVQFDLEDKEKMRLFKRYQNFYLRRYKVKRRSKFA